MMVQVKVLDLQVGEEFTWNYGRSWNKLVSLTHETGGIRLVFLTGTYTEREKDTLLVDRGYVMLTRRQ